jgi:phage FluMu protein Com
VNCQHCNQPLAETILGRYVQYRCATHGLVAMRSQDTGYIAKLLASRKDA